ncbi:MAG: N-acetylneuraminate synthase [Fimbriimonadaceae bacterium]|nr:N-acetylneuraminate synthase [Fimbriimonadaceae bacterium]
MSFLPNHCFIIAEAGVNHNGSRDMAIELIDAAARSGADAVKFQSFRASELVTASAPKAEYQKAGTGEGESQLEMLKSLELSEADHVALIEHCRSRGISFLSTPFDIGSAEMLARLGAPALKLGSGELTNLPFLAKLARLNLPVILSTGMSHLGEVEDAVLTMEAAGQTDLTLLHCVSNYPAAAEDVNLRAMETLRTAFGLPVGYSDHTLGNEVCLAAVALGARVIEKHFTLDRSLPGPDHQASLEPDEIAAMVASVRVVESAMGTGRKVPAASEAGTASVARRSVVAARDLTAGSPLTEEDLAIRRPGTGLPPKMLSGLLGRTLRTPVAEGTPILLDHLG